MIASKDVQRALDALPEAMREVATGYWLEGSTAKEVALDRGSMESTVRKHLTRAKSRLCAYLRDYEPVR